MTSIMLSSNANSAMIQTIEASESRRNPNVYSTETIYPAHAMTWVKCEKSSGTIGAGSQLNFQLQKYGIISQMLLCYTKQFTAGNNALPAGDIFKTIRQVELLASSKIVSTLTAEDLMAQFSNCKQSEFNVVRETALKSRVLGALETTQKYVIPPTFAFFESVNTQLDSSFLEPLQIRITWGTSASSSAGANTTYAADPIGPDYHLLLRYKNYDEQTKNQVGASESTNMSAAASVFGGGIYAAGLKISFYDCNIVNNSAARTGGGIYLGSGSTSAVISGPSAMSGNRASVGGSVIYSIASGSL